MDGVLMNLQALQNCLIVEEEHDKHPLLVLPQQKTGNGVVLKAGEGCETIHEGDRICFGSSVGQKFKHEGKDYLVMREEHVLGVFDD